MPGTKRKEISTSDEKSIPQKRPNFFMARKSKTMPLVDIHQQLLDGKLNLKRLTDLEKIQRTLEFYLNQLHASKTELTAMNVSFCLNKIADIIAYKKLQKIFKDSPDDVEQFQTAIDKNIGLVQHFFTKHDCAQELSDRAMKKAAESILPPVEYKYFLELSNEKAHLLKGSNHDRLERHKAQDYRQMLDRVLDHQEETGTLKSRSLFRST